ncbi:MAG: YdbH domain-containing protein [Desulfamplus sp.]|nr:YdbH domain-containing protein [Desulfamplus sp.]
MKTFLLMLILTGLTLSIILPAITPPIAKRLVIEKVSSIQGLENFNLDIQTIGISGIGVGNITTGDSISVDSLFCEYSLTSLMKKKINRLNISGLEIKSVIDNSSIFLTDFVNKTKKLDTDKQTDTQTNKQSGEIANNKIDKIEEKIDIKAIAAILPFLPPSIEINHSFLSFKDSKDNNIFTLPFNLLCKIENNTLDKKSDVINLLLTPLIFGQRVKISLEANISNHSIFITFHNISWSSLNEIFPIVSPKSDIKITGNCDITLSMSKDISKWKVTVSHIGIEKPIQGEINNVVLNLSISDLNNLLQSSQTSLQTTSNNESLNRAVYSLISAKYSFWFGSNNISPVNVSGSFTMNSGDKWSLILKGKEMWRDKPFMVGSKENAVRFIAPDFQLYCNGDEASFDGKFTALLGGLTYKEQDIRLGKIDCKLPFNYSDKLKRLTFDGNIKIDQVATIPVNSTIQLLKDKGLRANLNYKLPPLALTPDLIRKIYTPDVNKGESNSNNTDGDSTKDREINIFSGVDFNLNLTSDGNFAFYNNKIVSDVKVNLTNGSFAIPENKINITGINSSISFKGIPDIKPLPAQILTVEKIDIKDLRLSNAKIRYSIESNPTQSNKELKNSTESTIQSNNKVKSSTSGESTSGGDDLKYSPALLVENASFNWCDGKVISESMRFSFEQSDYHISLFCDRLKLSSILEQLGSFKSEGDGTLNGRIPISVSGGNITFDNGFLYSTPGQGGNIKLSSTDRLTDGIPKDTPQFNQLDLAKEALKNYRYEWARLGFTTQGDELIIKMELNGKPEKPLPFVYNKELGSFVRVNSDKSGSNFQGVKIDVNLKMPFNKVLRFGNELNNILK